MPQACPDCDDARIHRRQPSNPMSAADDDAAYRCSACGATFDEPVEREARPNGSTTPTDPLPQLLLASDDSDQLVPDGGERPSDHSDVADEAIEELDEAFVSSPSAIHDYAPDPTPDPANCCVECGEEAFNHRCGSCGRPLCGMHAEVGGGFCSDFTTVGGRPGCEVAGEFHVADHLEDDRDSSDSRDDRSAGDGCEGCDRDGDDDDDENGDAAALVPDGGRSRCADCGAVLPAEPEPGVGVYCPSCGTGQHVSDGGTDREPIFPSETCPCGNPQPDGTRLYCADCIDRLSAEMTEQLRDHSLDSGDPE